MKQIIIPGCSTDLTPDDKPAVSCFGMEGVGKSRFAATAPGPIGLIALDKKSKRTFCDVAGQLGTQVIANIKPLMTDREAIDIAMTDGDTPAGLSKIKTLYTDVVKRVMDLGMKYAEHPDIQSIVVDTNSQLFDFILFSHFGRRNQIKPTSRGAPNQDMIDFVNATRAKNLVLIHRSKEIWKSTGATDKDGQQIKEPSGKFEQDGFKNIGAFVTLNVELTSKRVKTEKLEDKFRVKVVSCQSRAMLEGHDLHEYDIAGEDITWANLMMITGVEVG